MSELTGRHPIDTIEPGLRRARQDQAPSHDEMVSALRSLPHGGLDDTARHLALPPAVRSAVSPLVVALRWSAIAYGMIFGTVQVFATGDFAIVGALTACLFLTTWRTSLPLKLGSPATPVRVAALTDTFIVAVAAGVSGLSESPFRFCVMAAVAVAAFGWGASWAAAATAVGAAGLVLGQLLAAPSGWPSAASLSAFAITVVVVAVLMVFAHVRLLDAERRRQGMAGRLEILGEANDLLTVLNSVARTLPNSLNQREALDAARVQLTITFRPSVIALLELDESHDEWIPKLAEGCMLRPTATISDLPVAMQQAIESSDPVLYEQLGLVDPASEPAAQPVGVASTSQSGLYVRLQARGRTVGVIGLEHPVAGHFRERDVRLVVGLADVVALSLDNARWFGRLRSLGAEEERSRIARDLHDRLGQWLTYISFELEGIMAADEGRFPELGQLYVDVQRALEELRDTLRQLRSGVSEDQPLARVAREITQRFTERTEIPVDLTVTNPDAHLSVPIENELLRILQEALTNIDKHAKADLVQVTWNVVEGRGTLIIHDNGRGFSADQGVRDSAYGLVGMRERADVIAGRLKIDSTPGNGTTITVVAGSMPGSKEESA